MTEAYEIEGRRIGVRWSRAGLDAELRALAGTALGPQEAPPNLSILMGERTGRTRAKHHLHVQGQLCATTGSDRTLVRAVVRALATLGTAAPPDTVTVDGFLVVTPTGGLIVVDRRLMATFRQLEPRLRRSGSRVIEVPHLVVRPSDATVMLPDVSRSVRIVPDELDRRWAPGGGDDDLVSHHVAASLLIYSGNLEPESRAAAVADLVPLVHRGARVFTADVARLATLATNVRIAVVVGLDHDGLGRALGMD